MTARDLINRSLQLLNVIAVGETVDATEAEQALVRLNQLISTLATQRLSLFYESRTLYNFVVGQQDYTLGPGGDFNTTRPLFISRMSMLDDVSNPTYPLELPLNIWTTKDWQLQSIKAVTSTYPLAVYPNYAFPLMTLSFWPIPQLAVKAVLYLPVALTSFTTLDTDLSFPPGYDEMLEYNLALRLARPYGLVPPEDVVMMARDSMASIKRANRRLEDVSLDAAVVSGEGGGYNYRSNTFGSSR